jgi:hypothetical protein
MSDGMVVSNILLRGSVEVLYVLSYVVSHFSSLLFAVRRGLVCSWQERIVCEIKE